MDKCGTHYTHTTHYLEYYLAIKNKIFVICDHMEVLSLNKRSQAQKTNAICSPLQWDLKVAGLTQEQNGSYQRLTVGAEGETKGQCKVTRRCED